MGVAMQFESNVSKSVRCNEDGMDLPCTVLIMTAEAAIVKRMCASILRLGELFRFTRRWLLCLMVSFLRLYSIRR